MMPETWSFVYTVRCKPEHGRNNEITLSNYSMATQKAINIIAQFGDDLLVDAKEGSENDLAYRRTGFIRVKITWHQTQITAW